MLYFVVCLAVLSFIPISTFWFIKMIMRSALLCVALHVLCASAFSWNAYDLGFHGMYPRQRFRSVDFEAPAPKITQWDSRCDSGSLFLTPRGPLVTGAARGPIIMDPRGKLIWMGSHQFEQAMNLNVQQYKGQDYLTFWTKVKKNKQKKHSKKSYVMVRLPHFPSTSLNGTDLSA